MHSWFYAMVLGRLTLWRFNAGWKHPMDLRAETRLSG